jgi:probable HAF family extracellular repeat protein
MRNNSLCISISLAFVVIVSGLPPSVALVLGDDLTASSPSFKFITIDIPTPNRQLGFTALSDINENGIITGGFTNSTLAPYGFRLDKKMRSTDLRCSKDVVSIEPQSLNKHGEIVGFATVTTDIIKIPAPPFEIVITKLSGFFRDKQGRCTILDFPGANLTEATGVNDDGQVVGNYRDAAGKFHGFFWDAGLFLTFNVPFADASITAPTAINNVGQIVGFYFDNNVTASFPNGHAHGFIYDNGVFSAFDFPQGVETYPADINDHGVILGVYEDANFVGGSFLLQDGTFTTFEVPFSGVFATAVSGINNKGQIVGRYIEHNPDDPVNPFLSHGFIATPKTKLKLVAQIR